MELCYYNGIRSIKVATEEEINRLKCEKILNENWAKAIENYDELKRIVERGSIANEEEESTVMIVAIAALGKMTMDKAIDGVYLS